MPGKIITVYFHPNRIDYDFRTSKLMQRQRDNEKSSNIVIKTIVECYQCNITYYEINTKAFLTCPLSLSNFLYV